MNCLLPLAGLLLLPYPSGAEKRTIACKTPDIAASCYQTHGRLHVYNGGYPNLRLWKIGTHDMLGIYDGPAEFAKRGKFLAENPEGDDQELPANLDRIYNVPNSFDITVYADFEVCPLEPHIPGHMQAACIESAKHLVVKK